MSDDGRMPPGKGWAITYEVADKRTARLHLPSLDFMTIYLLQALHASHSAL